MQVEQLQEITALELVIETLALLSTHFSALTGSEVPSIQQ